MLHAFALACRWRVAPLLLLFFFFILSGRFVRAQAPDWQLALATHQQGNGFAQVSALAADASGDVYLAGHFTGTLALGAATLTTADRADVFVAKWSAARHAFAWARQAGGPGLDLVSALVLDGANVYLAGTYDGPTARFGSTGLTDAHGGGGNAYSGYGTAFVAKLADAGGTADFAWAWQVDGTGSAAALAVADGNVYLTGRFYGTARFGGTTLTSAGGADLFVAKLVDAGPSAAFAWTQPAGGADEEAATALAVNGANVYVSGRFSSRTAAFGATRLAGNPAGTYPFTDVFVAKLTDDGPTGHFVWALPAGGTGADSALGLAVTGASVYVAGYFSGPSAAFGATTLAAAGVTNAFVAKLTDAGPAGAFGWALGAGGTGPDSATAVAVQGRHVYVAGTFGSVRAAFGATTLANAGPGGYGSRDVFVARLADAGGSGRFEWAQAAGGTGDDFATAVAVRGPRVYVAGAAAPPAAFGPLALATPAGTQGGFLAALTDATATGTAAAAGWAGTLAPNPARTAATLTLPAGYGEGTAALTLFDAQGRAVRTETVGLPATGLRHELSLAGLPAGLYVLRITASAATTTHRLVVE